MGRGGRQARREVEQAAAEGLGAHPEAPEPEAYRAALDIALGYLGYRPRSRTEVERHLQSKDFAVEVREWVLRRLRELELVDDAAFARYWVRNRERFRPRSARALRHELYQKGVAERHIDAALEDFDALQSAVRALLARSGTFRSLDPREREQRCRAYLARRGYAYGVARQAIRQASREWDDGGREPAPEGT